MAESSSNTCESCPFCKISNQISASQDGRKNDEENQPPEYFFADDDVFVIKDIKPRAPHHYLVITRRHIESAKNLTRKDVDLVRRMVETGTGVLKDRYKDKEVDPNEVKVGFHWPPLVLVKHLHMHVLYPASEMSFFMKNGIFRPGFLFATPEWLIGHINTIPDPQQSA